MIKSRSQNATVEIAMRVTAKWTQDYSYDRYANKTGVSATGVDGAGGWAGKREF